MSSVPKRYVPKQLSKKDKKKQAKELKRSRKAYKKGWRQRGSHPRNLGFFRSGYILSFRYT